MSMSQTMDQPILSFSTVLVANRGEIAIRLIQAVQALNLRAIAVFISEDSTSPHIRIADQAVSLGSSHTLYSDIPALLKVAKDTGAEAVLPGYGFVSENPDAVKAFEQAGIVWIGPRSETITLFGLKHTAREAAVGAGVPTVPGSPVVTTFDEAEQWATKVAYPVLVKASAGGGGMGQAIAKDELDLHRAYASVKNQSASLFASTDLYLERYVEKARHIEVQVFGDGNGACLALGDRECSVQRRRQKVIEEGSAPNLSDALRNSLREAAAQLCAKHKYRSAGTVEFILDDVSKEWYFLEVNTRLQVEHGVTEMVSGIDIVRWMLLQAGGIDVVKGGKVQWTERGHAIEARIYAENPVKDYTPCPGTLSEMTWPEEHASPDLSSRTRVDAWAETGTIIPPHYDPMLGKVIAWGKTRPLAIIELKKALQATVVRGVVSNVELLLQATGSPDFLRGMYTTSLLNTIRPKTNSVEVVCPGLQSSLQDYPGRIGYWDVGVSPSGPMDAYAMGMANSLVGNPISATALEITVSGPTLVFHSDAVVAIAGGNFHAEVDEGKFVQFWTPFKVNAGSVLTIGKAIGRSLHGNDTRVGGRIAYLAVRGGFDAPKYLGSTSTFPTGKFGGLNGSYLSNGDFLPVCSSATNDFDSYEENGLDYRWPVGKPLPVELVPNYDNEEWTIAALNGPHASEDFLHEETLQDIWTIPYAVHHATNRLGARLIGPSPKWTRADGGSAGLHPSNLHDYTYAPGAVNFSGNTPIVLMLDGPSLGGFVCPITVASSDLWKVAQASPGEKIRFKQVNFDQASAAVSSMESAWEAVRMNDLHTLHSIMEVWTPWWATQSEPKRVPAVLASLDPAKGDTAEIKVCYRMSGDEHILVEYGDIELDLVYRLRVHMMMEELKFRKYIKELCPGVRSLLIRYDRKSIHVQELVSTLTNLEKGVLGSVEDVVVPSRTLELPLAFADRWTIDAQQRYLRSVRPNAPYMPSNVEFVRRINGLHSVEDVKKIMTCAEYMVLGLGDVYLGAPCAVPVDPRHRMVSSKYNPARTYTPEGAVGIGGAYMCIYGMDSPGGYQLAGRTLPIWDNYGSVPESHRGAPRNVPWLLRFFDRVKFYAVSDDELEELRSRYRKGDYTIKIVEDTFSYKKHVDFVCENQQSIDDFERRRDLAYKEERARWEADGEGESVAAAEHANISNGIQNGNTDSESSTSDEGLPPFSISVKAGMSASVWAAHVNNGDHVKRGQELFSLESMKVEISVEAPEGGIVQRVSISKGESVSPGTELCIVVSSAEAVMGDLCIKQLQSLYRLGVVDVKPVISFTAKSRSRSQSVFSENSSDSYIESQITRVRERARNREFLPLYGTPFVVADDVDVEGFRSHAGSPGISYGAIRSNPVVQQIQKAGAILVGKTRVDQLNVGYTGCEVLGDIPMNPVCPEIITGGNGSAAIAVQQDCASFAVVIDRNGTSTISPALCNVWGLKTTEGLLPIGNVLQSSVDCYGVYAKSADDIRRVLDVCMQARQNEAVLRALSLQANTLGSSPGRFRLGVCKRDDLSFAMIQSDPGFGGYYKAAEAFKGRGYELTTIDVRAFIAAAELCSSTPVNYMQFSSLSEAVRKSPRTRPFGRRRDLLPSVERRVLSVEKVSVLEIGEAFAKLQQYRRELDKHVWRHVDVLLLPATPTSCKTEDVSKDIAKSNTALGRFAQLVTLLDLCCMTIPGGSHFIEKESEGILAVAPGMMERDLLHLGTKS